MEKPRYLDFGTDHKIIQPGYFFCYLYKIHKEKRVVNPKLKRQKKYKYTARYNSFDYSTTKIKKQSRDIIQRDIDSDTEVEKTTNQEVQKVYSHKK